MIHKPTKDKYGINVLITSSKCGRAEQCYTECRSVWFSDSGSSSITNQLLNKYQNLLNYDYTWMWSGSLYKGVKYLPKKPLDLLIRTGTLFGTTHDSLFPWTPLDLIKRWIYTTDQSSDDQIEQHWNHQVEGNMEKTSLTHGSMNISANEINNWEFWLVHSMGWIWSLLQL